MRTAIAALAAAALVAHVAAARQEPARPLNWADDDGRRVAALAANGRRLEASHVVVWVPPAIADAEHRALVDRLDRGVAALRARVGSHPWQVIGSQRITYYISEDRFVSHGTGQAAVFVPLVRVQDGRAPLLHEAMHELLAVAGDDPTPRRPLWLTEGLPDYVAQTVATSSGIAEGDVFETGGLEGVDRTCASRLQTPAAAHVLPFMGAPGRPDALFTTERQTVAPTFYACAFSFTKAIVQRIGLAETIALTPLIPREGVHARIERIAGKTMAQLREEWLRAIHAAR